MKVKALKSFGGIVSMAKGSEKDIKDEVVLKDLLKAGYVEAVEEDEDDTEDKPASKPKKKSQKRR